MNIFLRLIKESVLGAFSELNANRLRAFLSVLGVTIGIFCIITVFSAVDSLEKSIRQSFEKLGENVIYVQKFSWEEDPRMSWWKYFRRPSATYSEFKMLESKLTSAEAVAIMLFMKGKTLKQGSYTVTDADLFAASHDYEKIKELEFEQGRYFSFAESHRGANVAIIGSAIAAELFSGRDVIEGSEVKLMNRTVKIVGVLKKEGDDVIGFTLDNNIIIPYNYAKTIVDVEKVEPLIAVKGREGVSPEAMKDELRGVMRSVRKLKPSQDDNFAMNQLSIITGAVTMVFGVITVAGGIIGLFSVLVGGFGIANIMFVSVKERTHLIGIKKALGAKRYFILVEFMTEAVALCLLGGVMGLLLVLMESYLWQNFLRDALEMSFPLYVSARNLLFGILLSAGIGIIAGFIPALMASLMKPVDAIRG